MKIFTIFVFLFTSFLAQAKQVSDEQLKITGRALANYQICANVAQRHQDQAMFNYYSDIHFDSLQAGKMLSIRQVQIIFDEQQQTAVKLAAIDKSSLTGLCISRFDALSRKMQEQKLQ
ncbi:hypothetical protein [Psychromonas sp.]|uniref:hypothetical protein n=1 Tax=Psychromonas sp. TaxID=1884585 RepID=UPI003569FBA0